VLSSQFRPERYYNLIVWDDHSRIWEPDARAKAVVTLYVAKDLELASTLGSLRKYEVVDVIGA